LIYVPGRGESRGWEKGATETLFSPTETLVGEKGGKKKGKEARKVSGTFAEGREGKGVLLPGKGNLNPSLKKKTKKRGGEEEKRRRFHSSLSAHQKGKRKSR